MKTLIICSSVVYFVFILDKKKCTRGSYCSYKLLPAINFYLNYSFFGISIYIYIYIYMYICAFLQSKLEDEELKMRK